MNGLKRESTLMQLVGKHLDDPASFSASEKKEGKHKSMLCSDVELIWPMRKPLCED